MVDGEPTAPSDLRVRSLHAVSCLAAIAATLASSSRASATWFGEAGLEAARHEVAIASGARTVVWTRVRFAKTPGGFALIVPAPDGSALDVVSDAWLDALDQASAPRVFPPASVSASCPNEPPPDFEIVGGTKHEPQVSELETLVLDDAAAVESWGQGFGFALPSNLKVRLAETPGRFWVMRFAPHDGEAVSPTLRVTLPLGATTPLPIGLALAGTEPLEVTAWAVGKGSGALGGADPVTFDAVKLTWRAADDRSDYLEQREALLDEANADGSAPLAVLAEAAGHDLLSSNTPVHDGDAVLDAALATYFLRAEEVGALEGASAASCIAIASGIMASASPVAAVCAPGDHGSSGTAEACAEDVGAGELDPSALRCGYGETSGVTDDLALAFAGLAPSEVWLTRFALRVPTKELGASFPVTAAPGGEVLPSFSATQVSFAGCQTPDGGTGSGQTGSGSGSGSGTGSGSGSGSSTGGDVYIPTDGCDCGDPGASSSGVIPDPGTGEIPVSEGCDCAGSGPASGDSCDCGDGAIAAESCDCGDGAVEVFDSCDCGGSVGAFDACGDCAIHQKTAERRRRSVRVSALTFFLGCLLVPLRRWGRRDPSRKHGPKKPKAAKLRARRPLERRRRNGK